MYERYRDSYGFSWFVLVMIGLSVWTFPFSVDDMQKGKFVADTGFAVWSLFLAGIDAAVFCIFLNLAGTDLSTLLAERRERQRLSAVEGLNLLDKALLRFEQNKALTNEALSIMKGEQCREDCMSRLSRAQQKSFDAQTMLAAGRYRQSVKMSSNGFVCLSTLENELHETIAHHERKQHKDIVQVSETIIATETIEVRK